MIFDDPSEFLECENITSKFLLFKFEKHQLILVFQSSLV